MVLPPRNSPYELSLSPIRESASLINASHAQYFTALIVLLHWATFQYDLLASLETITRAFELTEHIDSTVENVFSYRLSSPSSSSWAVIEF